MEFLKLLAISSSVVSVIFAVIAIYHARKSLRLSEEAERKAKRAFGG